MRVGCRSRLLPLRMTVVAVVPLPEAGVLDPISQAPRGGSSFMLLMYVHAVDTHASIPYNLGYTYDLSSLRQDACS